MKLWVFRALVNELQREWIAYGGGDRPWGIWIRYYLEVDSAGVAHSERMVLPERVWFLDRKGIRSMNIWSYARLEAVHLRFPVPSTLMKSGFPPSGS